MVQSPRARAHPPADARPAAPRDRAGERPRLHAVPLSLAAPEAAARSFTVPTARCTSSSSCRATRFPPPPGKAMCCGAESESTRPSCSISCASPARSCGAGCRRIRRSTIRSGARTARPGACRPTRSAPVALFLRDDAPWLLEAAAQRAARRDGQAARSTAGTVRIAAQQVLESLSRAARRSSPMSSRDTRQLTSVVEDALWELAAAGLVTADGFENLRALIDPKRRLATAQTSRRAARGSFPAAGRCFAARVCR